jgi:hypothetical protein
LRIVTALAVGVREQHRPLRVDVVFATETIEAYLASLTGRAALRSIANYASDLYRIQARVLPEEAYGPGRRKPHGNGHRADIYDDQATARFLRWARTRRSAATQRQSLAVIALIRGAGAEGTEAGYVRPEDITVDGTDVRVTLGSDRRRRRTVTVLEPFGSILAAIATETRTSHDTFLLGGTSHRRRGRASSLLRDAHMRGVDLDLLRLRDSALVDMCVQYRLPELLAALGMQHPASLERIWPVVRRQVGAP